ncbi:hypothetical protein [Microbacterium sp. T32]|uniref:hypothetical protein n=1 Tax=Microbacterium sp. T32 TaxID=1776083 RepID=UPI0007AB6B6A|nr:hypothetical protein [Microbacterium sp. T32]KZE41429.1 hypothetical protein AVW09_02235 [Microbacterium sp. T32]
MKATNAGSGSFGNIQDWSVTETVTPFVVSDTTTSIGDATLSVIRTPDTDLVDGNRLGLAHPVPGYDTALPETVNRVGMTGPTQATLNTDSAFGVFISSRMQIPGIETGLPLSALDVACQAAGLLRQTGPNAGDDYWSLQGHTVGVSSAGDILSPKTADRSLLSANGSPNYASEGGETVLYQEISRHAAANTWSAAGFPRRVIGGTVQHTRERTYIKFTINPYTSIAPVTFSVSFGPSFRRIGDNSNIANTTSISVTSNLVSTTGALTVTVLSQDTAAATQTATATTGQIAALARTRPVTVCIEIATVGGALRVRAVAASSAGQSSTLTATSQPLVGELATLYSKQWIIQQSTAGQGFRDLVVASSTSDRWASFIGTDYALNPAITPDAGASFAAGSPIAPFDGELWDYVKQVCSARGVELASTPSGIIARRPGVRVIDLTGRASASRTISGASVARAVVVTNHRTKTLDITGSEAWRATSIYSVDVGQTTVVNLPVPKGIRFLASPRPWYNTKVARGIYVPAVQYLDGYADLEAGTVGRYYITAQDGYPVSPVQWTNYGGRLTVSVTDGVATMTLTGPSRAIPGVAGPFRIGESSNSSDYAVLRLFGAGVTTRPTEVTLPSGACPRETRVETGSTVTNVAIGNIGEVYNAAAWVAQRTSGPSITLTAQMPMGLLGGWAAAAGSLVTWEGNVFRVDGVSYANGVGTLTCSKLSRLSDMPGKNRTLAQYASDYAGMTLHDYAIRPLDLAAPAA